MVLGMRGIAACVRWELWSRVLVAGLVLASRSVRCVSLAGAQTPSLYERAQDAFKAKHFSEAAPLFAAYAALDSNSDALLMEGKALVNTGDLSHAEQALRGYVAQNLRSSDAMYLLGYVLQRENHPKESLEWLTKAAAVAPPKAEDLKIAALDYVLLDDYDDAVRWLQRALQSDDKDAEIWYSLGRARMMQGNYTAAEQAFHRALILAPTSVKAENNLGLTYEAENRNSEALAAYAAAIAWQQRIDHPSEQPLLNYGTLLISQNRSAEAVTALESAARIAPANAKCHEQLARAYEQTGEMEKAQRQMEEAVRLDNGNARLHYQLGQMYRHAGKATQAKDELDRSAKLYGTHGTPEDK